MSSYEGKEPLDHDACRSLTDDEIVTERTLSRRSFVAAAGVFLTGGAMALLADRQGLAQVADPNQTPPPDPNRPADPNKPTDPDKPATDPDGKKHHHHHHHHKAPPPTDPNRPTDPNAPPPPDPH